MKLFLSLIPVLGISLSLQAQTWKWDGTPKANENVVLQVADLPKEEPVHFVYYGFDGTKLICGDMGAVPSEKPGQLDVPVVLHDHFSWVRVVMKDKNHEVLSGDQQKVINEKAMPKADLIEEALASSIYGRILGIDANDPAILNLYNEAVKAYPQWLNEPDVLRGYYGVAKRTSSTPDLDIIKNHLNSLTAKSNGTSEALLVQATRTAKDMADTTLQVALRKKLDKNYPKSLLAQEEMLTSFTKAVTAEEKIKIRDQFKSKYPVTKENTRMMDQMTSGLVQHYATKEDWTNAKVYIAQIIDPMTHASVCNNYAWKLSGESIEAEAPHLDIAGELSATSLQLLTTDSPPPTGLTKKEWDSNKEYSRAMYGDTYALILFKQGKYDEAIDHQAYSVQKYEYEDAEMNERYVIYLDKAGRKNELAAFMDKIYVTGKATEKVKEFHKKYWTQDATQEELYMQYVAELDAKAKALREANIMKKWEDREAVPFIVKDLSGNEVSLADYKGKTIVLDFWATWCGPCKASFPGMKKAVEYFASDKNVAFLFVDTWESGDNVAGKVSDFIKTNNYPFHVLMDLNNKIVSDYKVDGIPTKFIIGPDQKIRFTSVGYGGNPDELMEEIKTMIEMVKENASMQKT